ncbi:ion channel [Salegentibacter salegens]|uniref:Ion channel n=1 Tax=Salegentibacter salegens TaxID=143223 RepID=A0A1M7KS29_9FLAO|nr:ion channel [Salegentibacter salegens]PRX48823.1 ion channel [Salegentibacter salegens]SHM68355.1 Ion channel [Salegentibacter salegens]
MSGILLFIGIVLLLLAIHDFFFTTLSGSGTGFLSRNISILSDKIIQFCVKIFGRKAYNYNGLFVNLMILFIWLLLIWVGLFLVYSSNPDAITSSSGKVANFWERLYFTSYTLSTLGMGNFTPNTAAFELLTGAFSFFGFIFFTSSMTYFLSVSSALVNKRTLSKSIYHLGKTPQEIAKNILSFDSSFSYQQFSELQKLIDKHSVNHHAYPVVHFYRQSKKKDSFSINIARLDEAVSILLYSEEKNNYRTELNVLRSSLSSFLEDMEKNFASNLSIGENTGDSYNFPSLKSKEEKELRSRRNIVEGLFRSENYTWEDIFAKS